MASRRRGIDPIGQAAGLSAGTPVAAASSDNGAEGALTGVAHTKSAVGKDLHLRRTVPADGGNVPAGQLTGQHHTGKAQLCRPACAPQRVQAHLGAGVEGQLRRRLTGQLPHPPILDQHRICPQPGGLVQQLRRPRKLPVGEQGVQGQIDLHPSEMAVPHRLRKLLLHEVFGAAPGVVGPEAHIHGIGAALHGGHQRIPPSGGREQLRHYL